jgi:hypothetical protein
MEHNYICWFVIDEQKPSQTQSPNWQECSTKYLDLDLVVRVVFLIETSLLEGFVEVIPSVL